jgi:hypothetical protein
MTVCHSTMRESSTLLFVLGILFFCIGLNGFLRQLLDPSNLLGCLFYLSIGILFIVCNGRYPLRSLLPSKVYRVIYEV